MRNSRSIETPSPEEQTLSWSCTAFQIHDEIELERGDLWKPVSLAKSILRHKSCSLERFFFFFFFLRDPF